MIKVNERIEDLRIQKGKTKVWLAGKLGISAMGYHYLSNGRTPINTNRLQIIADALETPASDLLRP